MSIIIQIDLFYEINFKYIKLLVMQIALRKLKKGTRVFKNNEIIN